MTQKIIFLGVAVVLCYAGGFLTHWHFFCKAPVEEKPYWADKKYRPDTIYVDTFYMPALADGVIEIPPAAITQYKTFSDNNTGKFQVSSVTSDSITLVDTTNQGNTLSISSKFVTSFHSNPKLLEGYFDKDRVELTLFSVDSKVEKKTLLLNSGYEYWYRDGKFYTKERIPNNSVIPSQRTNIQLEFGPGYSFFDQSFVFDIDARIMFSQRWTGEVQSKLWVAETPRLYSGISLKYNLWQRR